MWNWTTCLFKDIYSDLQFTTKSHGSVSKSQAGAQWQRFLAPLQRPAAGRQFHVARPTLPTAAEPWTWFMWCFCIVWHVNLMFLFEMFHIFWFWLLDSFGHVWFHLQALENDQSGKDLNIAEVGPPNDPRCGKFQDLAFHSENCIPSAALGQGPPGPRLTRSCRANWIAAGQISVGDRKRWLFCWEAWPTRASSASTLTMA